MRLRSTSSGQTAAPSIRAHVDVRRIPTHWYSDTRFTSGDQSSTISRYRRARSPRVSDPYVRRRTRCVAERLSINMASPLAQFTTRIAYGARQLPRVAWYMGHSLVMRRLANMVREREGESRRIQPPATAPVPERLRLYADMAELFRQDLANVEASIYPLPADHDGTLAAVLNRSRVFFEDLPNIHRRRKEGNFREVLSDDTRGRRPSYYLQNFHFQSGGWMTKDSARRYDTQVEVLFKGTANATRRQALVPLHEVFAGRDQRRLRLLDIGCGTGRFLDCVKQVWPRLPVVGLDLS